ncbi:MAG: S46 family peptidase [Bdellovibrionota bacterium]
MNTAIHADEGMWLFNQLPLEVLKQKYDFTPTPEWIDHVMKSSVRFNIGGSGSFISKSGLVLTNHHVASDTLQKLSTPQKNLYREGFYAETQDQEIKAPDLELNQLISIEDVTARVMGVVKPEMPPQEAYAAQKSEKAKIEKESFEQTGLRSDVVTLYMGGQFHLYRYKKYTDIRLVFAPELDIAFFGGDQDNFEFPRYDLDMAIFRAYENGNPVNVENYFSWSRTDVIENELIFVSGHPGGTDRIQTVSALKAQRDFQLPAILNFIYRQEIFLQQYGYEGKEQDRLASTDLFGIKNGRKVLMGQLKGLQDQKMMQAKLKAESELKLEISKRPELVSTLSAFDQIAEAEAMDAKLSKRSNFLEGYMGLNTKLFRIAKTLVRMAAEDLKKDSDRLPEFQVSHRASLEQRLFSTAPIYTQYEQAKLTFSLQYLAEQLGEDSPIVQKILMGKSPEERAQELIEGTSLAAVEVRKLIAKGGMKAIRYSQDTMIRLAAAIDPDARSIRKMTEDKVEGPKQQAYAEIAKALFAVYGTKVYPDATFTLRLTFGTVSGHMDNGQLIAPITKIGGAFEHERNHESEKPWKLPASWHQAKDKLNLEVPFNFISSADIIGGNSGSPVINRQGEFVGLIFDGNIHSTVGNFVYIPETNRAVAVNSGGILEALSKIYNAKALVEELQR